MDMGISLWDYLNRFRNQKARELLLLTDESITEVAAAVGYEDVGYFSRLPRNFRQLAACFQEPGQKISQSLKPSDNKIPIHHNFL